MNNKDKKEECKNCKDGKELPFYTECGLGLNPKEPKENKPHTIPENLIKDMMQNEAKKKEVNFLASKITNMSYQEDKKEECCEKCSSLTIPYKCYFKDCLCHKPQEPKDSWEEEPHDTVSGYCCACDYDIAVMEDNIHKVEAQAKEEMIEKIEKAIRDKYQDLVEIEDFYASEIFEDILSTIRNTKD